MAREEIAIFLETSPEEISQFWKDEHLSRSIYDDSRRSASIAQSSIFDVIEFALWFGFFPVKVGKAEAAMWVFYLCELCETKSWATWDLFERVTFILDAAQQDGLQSHNWLEPARIAATMAASHMVLLSVCTENDHHVTLFGHQQLH